MHSVYQRAMLAMARDIIRRAGRARMIRLDHITLHRLATELLSRPDHARDIILSAAVQIPSTHYQSGGWCAESRDLLSN